MHRIRVLAAVAISALTWSAACTKRSGVAAADVRAAIAAMIHAQHDSITITDPTTGTPVRLAFDHVHDEVDATRGGRHFACVDFRSAAGPVYDVDYYVGRKAGALAVQDVVVHQVGGRTVIACSTRARLDSVP